MSELISKGVWSEQRWGELRLDTTQVLPESFSKGTGQLFLFICTCKRTITLPFYRVTTGNTTSCGKCNFKSKRYWLDQTWGSLRLDKTKEDEFPPEWGAVRQKFPMVCDCTRTCEVPFKDILRGHNKSCGHCNDKPKKFWLEHEPWGSIKLKKSKGLPPEWSPFSMKKFTFDCSCGRTPLIPFYRVSAGNTLSCGQCSLVHRDIWLKRRFGSIRLDPSQNLPEYIKPYSSLKFKFLCACTKGVQREVTFPLKSVTGGTFKSCGKCLHKTRDYWESQQWGYLRLDREQTLPEEWGTGWKHKVWFVCSNCRKRKKCLFTYVLGGDTKSCGCLKIGENEFSEENEVRKFVASLDPTTHPKSWDIEGSRMKYDVYIKDRKFAIEYHGLHWHSERLKDEMEAKLIKEGKLKDRTPPEKKDRKKYELACSRGDSLIQIYEDEWKLKQPIMMGMIQDRVTPLPKTRIKPTFEVVLDKTPSEAAEFLNQNHYLGAASGCVTIIARHGSSVVGAWVFMKRETGVILWHRACWDRKYKSWNPHEKALKMALPLLKEMGFTKMVTFSDNRLHTGNLYEKLGFTFEEEIRPSYFYTNERIRKTKFSFRVPAGVNEEEAARAKGWYRIYDSGKKRYSLSL